MTRVKDRREATARRQRLDEECVAARWLSDRTEMGISVCKCNPDASHTVVVSSVLGSSSSLDT